MPLCRPQPPGKPRQSGPQLLSEPEWRADQKQGRLWRALLERHRQSEADRGPALHAGREGLDPDSQPAAAGRRHRYAVPRGHHRRPGEQRLSRPARHPPEMGEVHRARGDRLEADAQLHRRHAPLSFGGPRLQGRRRQSASRRFQPGDRAVSVPAADLSAGICQRLRDRHEERLCRPQADSERHCIPVRLQGLPDLADRRPDCL